MERRSAHRQYRCEATMHDGTTAVLFASTDSPAKALAMVRETWLADGVRSIRICVFRGGKTKAIAPAVADWREG